MKKILYFIPLFIFLFLLSSDKVLATNYYRYLVLKEVPITEEQKQEYLNYILELDSFKDYSSQYPYYLIAYQETTSHIFSTSYKNNISVVFYEEMPTFEFNPSANYKLRITTSQNKSLTYFINNGNIGKDYSIGYPEFSVSTGQIYDESTGDYITKYNFNINYVLSTNLEFSFGIEMPLYDSNMNLIKTYSADENIFASLNLKPEEDLTIESIEKADNTLYNLSFELLGELPEEFTFLYSLVQLFLGIVIVLIVLSPLILLLRLFR